MLKSLNLDDGTLKKCSASCAATKSGAFAKSPPSAKKSPFDSAKSKKVGAAEVARAISPIERLASSKKFSSCGVFIIRRVPFVTLTAGIATACFASASKVSVGISSLMASFKGFVWYLGTKRWASMSKNSLTGPWGALRHFGKMSGPRSLNTRTTFSMGTSKAIASAIRPPMDVPVIRSKRRPMGSWISASIHSSTRAVNRPL